MQQEGVNPQALIATLQTIQTKLNKIMQNYIPPFKPKVVQVDLDWVMKRLEKLPNWQWWKWFPLDGKYYTASLQDWTKMAKWDITNYLPYVADKFDCDKYAMMFKARMAEFFGVNAVAVVVDYDAGHAYNLVFPADIDEPLIYEPQTDQFIPIAQRDTRFYALSSFYIVLL